jgi:molecular chaperone DnaK
MVSDPGPDATHAAPGSPCRGPPGEQRGHLRYDPARAIPFVLSVPRRSAGVLGPTENGGGQVMTYALGIDLGTTFTAAAIARGGRVETVGLGNHAATVPSVVFLRADGELLVGDPAQRRGLQEPDRLAREFKRRFGDSTPILLGHTPYSAERLMATVLRQIVEQVTERYGGPPAHVAIAHPANWGPYKIELLRQAVQLAGLSSAQFVTEPEAAAVHYASSERVDPGEIVAVYDLGGGTFDAAVLRRTEDGFVTLGEPQGIERLGGIDFDQAVLSHVRATIGSELVTLDQTDPTVRASMARLREECVAAKETLSEDSETTISVMLPGVQSQVRLTRNEFEDVIRPPVRETVATLQRAIAVAGVTPADIKAVVLAGGSSRIPLITEMVRSEVGRPVVLDAHPKHTVALGAARIAEQRAMHPLAASPPAAPGTDATLPAPPARPGADATLPAPPPAPPRARDDALPPAGSPPSGAPPTSPQPLPAGAPRRSRRAPLLIGAAVIVLAAAAVIAVVALGGGDDDGTDTSATTTTGEAATTSTTEGGATTCEASSGRCIFLEPITVEGDHFVLEYAAVGFTPKIDDADATSHHIHFFYDTVPLAQAGSPGTGPWVLWDLDEDGEPFFRGYKTAEVPAGATSLCAVVATNTHALDEGAVPSCQSLP